MVGSLSVLVQLFLHTSSSDLNQLLPLCPQRPARFVRRETTTSACCSATAATGAATCTACGQKSPRCQRETGSVQPAPLRSAPRRPLRSKTRVCAAVSSLLRFSAKEGGETPSASKKRSRVKKRRYEDNSSDDETSRRRSSGGMATRHKETPAPSSSSSTPSSSSRYSGEGGGAKRRRMTTRNQPDLTFCE